MGVPGCEHSLYYLDSTNGRDVEPCRTGGGVAGSWLRRYRRGEATRRPRPSWGGPVSRAWLDRRFPARPSRVVLAAVVAFAVVVATTYAVEALALWSWFRPEADGIRMPPAVAAETSGLDDAEEVVGVVVNGEARAYRLGAFL